LNQKTELEEIPLIKGEIADYKFHNGILFSHSKNPKRTIQNISANVELVKKITGNRPVPLLIYLSDSPVPDKATRAYSTQQLPVIYKAMAMVSKPGLSQLIMKVLFRFTSPPIPMKSFTDDIAALNWLQQFR
jgi:hypothetical protein